MKRVCVLCILLLLATVESRGEQRDVRFTAADGFSLEGTFHSAEKGGPAHSAAAPVQR